MTFHNIDSNLGERLVSEYGLWDALQRGTIKYEIV